MKKPTVLLWVLIPVALIAWHYGPGLAQLDRDRAGEYLREAKAAASLKRGAMRRRFSTVVGLWFITRLT